jgi:hypothetical protein
MPLGEKTTRGLRYSLTICRLKRWKYCAGVVTFTRWILGTKGVRCRGSFVSWRNRSMRAEECSGPAESGEGQRCQWGWNEGEMGLTVSMR